LFQSQTEAKTFFVDKIVDEARAEGQPLSDDEQWMLRFSESDSDFIVDPDRVERLEAAISESAYEDKIVGLLQRCYQRDAESGADARSLYREASATLHQGDHYLLTMIDQVLGPVTQGSRGPKWVRGLIGFVLFVVLVLPGTIAILISVGMAAMLLSGQAQSSDEISRGGVASLVLGGIGYYLIHLWRRERRNRSLAEHGMQPTAPTNVARRG
jgi:hypothetical protein